MKGGVTVKFPIKFSEFKVSAKLADDGQVEKHINVKAEIPCDSTMVAFLQDSLGEMMVADVKLKQGKLV